MPAIPLESNGGMRLTVRLAVLFNPNTPVWVS